MTLPPANIDERLAAAVLQFWQTRQAQAERQSGAGGVRDTVRAREPHFDVFLEFKQTSYAQRYELLLTKMERLYASASLRLTGSGEGGQYREPSLKLSFQDFIASLLARTVTA